MLVITVGLFFIVCAMHINYDDDDDDTLLHVSFFNLFHDPIIISFIQETEVESCHTVSSYAK